MASSPKRNWQGLERLCQFRLRYTLNSVCRPRTLQMGGNTPVMVLWMVFLSWSIGMLAVMVNLYAKPFQGGVVVEKLFECEAFGFHTGFEYLGNQLALLRIRD